MEGIKIRHVSEEMSNAPLPKLPSNGNQVPHGEGQGVGSNTTLDPKKLKRVAANREYSQRYRLKQMQYIAQLESGVRTLQAQVETIYPKIKHVDTYNSMLREENCSMKEKLLALSVELMMKEVEYHELKKEKEALKKLSFLYQSTAAEISQAKHHSFSQLVNMTRIQTRFNPLTGESLPPMMQDQNLGNLFGSDVNNGENHNAL